MMTTKEQGTHDDSHRQENRGLIRTEGNELPSPRTEWASRELAERSSALDGFVKVGALDGGGRLRGVRNAPQALR